MNLGRPAPSAFWEISDDRERFASAVAGLLACLLAAPPAAAQLTFGDASVWDSTLAGPPTNPTFVPIGGSGQINGELTLDTVDLGGSAIQVGLRGQERFQGPTLTRVGNTYFADPGESTPGNALWNYDWHLDFGTSFLAGQLLPTSLAPNPSGGEVDSITGRGMAGLVPLNMRDFTVTFDFDTDPGPGASFVSTDFNALLDSFSVGPDVTLFQSSQMPPASVIVIPTLSEWAMILLTLLLAGVGVGWISRMG